MEGLRDAVGKMADYQVILNAVGWQEKGVLATTDLAELQELIKVKNTPIPEPPQDNIVTEPPVDETQPLI